MPGKQQKKQKTAHFKPLQLVKIDRLADPNEVVTFDDEDSKPAAEPRIPKTPDEQSRSQASEHPDTPAEEPKPRVGSKK